MSSLTLTDGQIPSTQNNNYIKIGGAIAVFIIIVIILYFSFSSSESSSTPTSTPSSTSTSTPSNPPITGSRKLELFSKCNFTDMNSEEKTIYATTIGPLTIFENPFQDDIEGIGGIKLSDMCIQSIKNVGYYITLYSNPDFTGDKITIINDENKECLEKPMRSAVILNNKRLKYDGVISSQNTDTSKTDTTIRI